MKNSARGELVKPCELSASVVKTLSQETLKSLSFKDAQDFHTALLRKPISVDSRERP